VDDLLYDAPCGFLSFNDSGTITLVNRTLLALLGYPSDVLTGASVERILTVPTRIFYQTHFFPLIRMHGHAEEVFLTLHDADGRDVGVLVNAVRRERTGEMANDCVLMRVRERQKYEQELLAARRQAELASVESERGRAELEIANDQLEQQALELELTSEDLQALNGQLEERGIELEGMRREAEEANLAKSNFLAMMSHELRTPLNAISGYAQLMEMGVHGPVTDAQRESLSRIQQSQRHLLRLVNEILNLARIESGHVDYDLADIALTDLVSPVLPLVEPQLQQKGISLEQDLPVDLAVRADVEKAQQILLNLLSNAIKFTPTGGTIAVTAASRGGGDEEVVIGVRDTGIGIPAAMLETIFDPFVQVEISRSRRGEGTGLGLAISRDLAEGMKGRLEATSVEGSGSTFYLTLPTPGAPPPVSNPA
jgi:PAS domain S-box-containing protein